MEDYSQLVENATPRGSFSYAAHAFTPNSSVYGCSSSGSNMQKHPLTINSLHQQSVECFPSLGVKMEGSSSQQMQGCGSPNEVDAIKAKIMAHPQYCNLLEAYMNCHKVLIEMELGGIQKIYIKKERWVFFFFFFFFVGFGF